MSFKRGGAHKRRDALEPELIHALRSAGVQVWQLHGTGLPDLLTLFRGRYLPLELKSSAGSLTAAQRAIPWPIVHSLQDAFIAIGVPRAHDVA